MTDVIKHVTNSGPHRRRYVLVSAAYNEEDFIEKTIQSIVVQSLPPLKWVIVSDGSTDSTDEIVWKYSVKYPFVELLRLEKVHKRNFAAQVRAINAGCEKLKPLDFDFLGNLDSDVVVPSQDYFERLLSKFKEFPNLGLGGGYICEEQRGEFKSRKTNSTRSVALAVQLFRRECFDEMGGGYVPLPYGGPDWCAEINVRMKGWQVESFPDLPVYHLRPTGAGTGRLRYWYQQGFMDFSLGSHPAFEIVKCLKRLPAKPYVIGAMARLTAFFLAYLGGEERAVSKDFVAFLRQDQMRRLRQIRNVPAMFERRGYPRFVMHLPFRLRSVAGKAEREIVTLLSRDISKTGLRFLAERRIEIGQSIEVEVNLVGHGPGGGDFQISRTGYIVRAGHCDKPGWIQLAARFDELPLGDESGWSQLATTFDNAPSSTTNS